MFLRSTNYLIGFILLITESFAAEEGMPQLNPEYWISQIFWLIIIFASLYIALSKIILPKISKNLETRKSQILDHLDQAEKFKEKTEKKIKEYEKILNESKKEAKIIMSESRKLINQNINKKKDHLKSEIEKEIQKTEDEIKLLKINSINNINKIAIETSSNIVKSIINIDLNKSNASAIVEDISKKNIKEYL
tara:strand:- start:611 stop:1189 length:579 start_codon:yes stop_codon:yes gene_type:complete